MSGTGRFVLYVEGPSDCDLLRTWAALVSQELALSVARCAVILGGRRPARAREHFLGLRAAPATPESRSANHPVQNVRGVCVLDRDGGPVPEGELEEADGLEFFTWSRRHIESYLLVPTAIRRCLRLPATDPRCQRLLGELLPPASDEEAMREVDAKRLLAPTGFLARELGPGLSPAGIARHMRPDDLHPDVTGLLSRISERV